MYLNHYNLKSKPFEESPDPNFFWLSETHKEALACLNYSIVANKAFLLLTGDIGTGKTSLINYLLLKNEVDAIVATMANPDLSIPDFFKLLSKKFKFSKDFNAKGDFLNQFEHFLHTTYSKGKKAILIIDEAQRLNQKLIEQIRLLSNIERKDAKLINIFFVGQNELIRLIRDKKNKALCQRVAVHHAIKPLTELETQKYILHRLGVAGSKNGIFSHEAVREIYSFSKGYPRLINTICDRALLTGYVSETKRINKAIVKHCTDELKSLTRIQRKMRNKEESENKKLIESFELYNEIKQPFVNNHNFDKATLNRRSIIKSSKENLFVDLDAVNPDTIEKAIGDLIDKVKSNVQLDQVKSLCKHQNGLEKIDKIDISQGDIVTHNGQIAFKLDFKISYNLTLLLDRKGNLINKSDQKA
jgi:type II secretory pathway predicted ATPase ExeA